MTQESLEQRLVEVERRLAFSERMAEDLSAVVTEQGRIIDALQRKITALTDRLRDLAADVARAPQDDRPPPHY